MEEIVRIPADRVKVLIGEEGRTKSMLEKRCSIELSIEDDGEVRITGETQDVYFSKDIIIAIGRGFNPKVAIKLLEPDYAFYIMSLKEHLHSDNAIKRIKGRIIGENGRMKKEIEAVADCRISVYGNTVAIIGRIDGIEYAKEAIEKIIRGAKHASVYKYLANAKRRLFEERLRGR